MQIDLCWTFYCFLVLNREWSDWSAWSKCTKSSGTEGVCVRQRVCQGPETGGPECSTEVEGAFQTQQCGSTNLCPGGEYPQDKPSFLQPPLCQPLTRHMPIGEIGAHAAKLVESGWEVLIRHYLTNQNTITTWQIFVSPGHFCEYLSCTALISKPMR